MTWPQFILYMVVGAGARRILLRFTPQPDAYLLVGLAVVFLIVALYRKGRRQALVDRWHRADEAEQEALAPRVLQEFNVLPPLPAPTGGEVVWFDYPTVSRSWLQLQFWFSVVFAAGTLSALLRQPDADPGRDWLLFGLAALFMLGAFGARQQLAWAGRCVGVDVDAVQLAAGRRVLERIEWVALARVTILRTGVLVFTARDGRELKVWPTLRDWARFENLVVRRLQPGGWGSADGAGASGIPVASE